MRFLKKIAIFLKIAFLIIISILISNIWWNKWMFEGTFSPPLFILKIFNASGEGAYDLIWIEMFLIIFLILLLIFFSINAFCKTFKKRASYKQNKKNGPAN
jgi:TRAP-type C4-dicarboxylate transport system permease small subunit